MNIISLAFDNNLLTSTDITISSIVKQLKAIGAYKI